MTGRLLLLSASLGSVGIACGPESPEPPPTLFVDASVTPTQMPYLPSCEAACHKLQKWKCPNTTIPDGDCRDICKHVEGLREVGGEPDCIIDARNCGKIEECQQKAAP